jgi:predicted amidophosphoribosyltransferase
MHRLLRYFHELGRETIDLFFSPNCAGCGELLSAGALCEICTELVSAITPPRCPVCGIPFNGAGHDHLCGRCIESLPPFSTTTPTFRYEGPIADGVVAVKYGRRVERIDPLASLWRDRCGPLPEVDLALPVPLHPTKLRRRGFNQTVLLSKPLLRSRKIALRTGALVKLRAGSAQAGLSRVERLMGPIGSYGLTASGVATIAAKRVLLLDDIMTTGATVRECTKVLLAGGAAEVHVAVLARA